MLYPLKFKPILKEMIWGGKVIPQKLNINIPEDNKIGESYTISGLSNDVSIIENGNYAGKSLIEIIDLFKGDILGNTIYNKFGNNFPLLIKFIDANDDLSIQVHPNDEQAKVQHDSFGKTEMWYIIDSQHDSSLISGFNKKTNSEEYEQMFKEGQLLELMKKEATQKGDCFFIPSGRVHSIGKGNILTEIQQTSNITYRIYDFDRKDKDGNPRELHTDLALKVMNFTDDDSGKIKYKSSLNEPTELINCNYFTTNLLNIKNSYEANYNDIDSFVIYICTEGSCNISTDNSTIELKEFEAILIPACLKNIKINSSSNVNLLEVYIN